MRPGRTLLDDVSEWAVADPYSAGTRTTHRRPLETVTTHLSKTVNKIFTLTVNKISYASSLSLYNTDRPAYATVSSGRGTASAGPPLLRQT